MAWEKKRLTAALSIAALIVSAGCGGGGSSGTQRPAPPVSYWDCGSTGGLALFIAWISGGCTLVTVSGSDQVPEESLPPETVEEWKTARREEVEPNDSVDTAVPLYFSGVNAQIVTGTVNDATDPGDFMAFAVEQVDTYAVYLCRGLNDCLEQLATDEAHIDLYDANRVLVYSTRGRPNGTHIFTFDFTVGVPYFLQVVAGETGGQDFPYQLIITQ
jgi:hypothetical protein